MIYIISSHKSNVTQKEMWVLKGLGHAILGNFSTDQIVIELS